MPGTSTAAHSHPGAPSLKCPPRCPTSRCCPGRRSVGRRSPLAPPRGLQARGGTRRQQQQSVCGLQPGRVTLPWCFHAGRSTVKPLGEWQSVRAQASPTGDGRGEVRVAQVSHAIPLVQGGQQYGSVPGGCRSRGCRRRMGGGRQQKQRSGGAAVAICTAATTIGAGRCRPGCGYMRHATAHTAVPQTQAAAGHTVMRPRTCDADQQRDHAGPPGERRKSKGQVGVCRRG